MTSRSPLVRLVLVLVVIVVVVGLLATSLPPAPGS
jgi:hypothetical protein